MKKARLLRGSCHCQAVKFTVRSSTEIPYQLCYCGICRKVQGGGGYAINIGGDAGTLKISGEKHLKKYEALVKNPEDKRGHRDGSWRAFCKECGTHLWVFAPDWPDLVHPFASCIDSKLPKAPEKTHCMLEFKASWVEPDFGPQDTKARRWPKESLAAWHERVLKKPSEQNGKATRASEKRARAAAPRKGRRTTSKPASSVGAHNR